jgi:hypothetical protein
MTAIAAAAAAHSASGRGFYLIALAVAVPFVVYAGVKLGDLVPYVTGLAVFAAVVWLGPLVPRSPLACTRPGGNCGAHSGTIALAELLLPVLVIVAYKEIRGDKRGVNGRRLP